MKAMVIAKINNVLETRAPLEMRDVPTPVPQADQILINVSTCGVCHTELDEIEGRTPPPRLPMIPGHQVVGQVVQPDQNGRFREGDRVGVAWIYHACGACKFCTSGQENLCHDFQATGRDADGGYAEYMIVPAGFAYPIPSSLSDFEAAPLLCAGAIGYRSIRLTGLQDGQRLGLTGFGASAHLVLKMVRYQFPNTPVYVFARSEQEQAFALELGAVWSGDTSDTAPEKLDCIIDTTPVWTPVIEAMRNLESGGRLVVNAIRKESIDQDKLMLLDYPTHLWLEKEIKSVANVARQDVSEFLELAANIPIHPEYQTYLLEDANRALVELKERKIRGAKVLDCQGK
ncbi:zinc-dependent alcohol dehydrogenase family protein [candidate division KSB1 bacterium]|nr:zinc-dependent alcohol dehydrogenase family protein [candidate division KSB1 bacterium]